MENSILTYRRRIIKAALLRHLRKTGGNAIVIKLPKGGITTIELTEVVMDGLLSRFELIARGEAGTSKGNETIKDIYYRSLDVNGHGEYLTETGKLLVDELIAEMVAYAKKAGTNKEAQK
ncbi:TPA: hypothetical protein JD203_08005 [Cronobacter sakazakii]|uniref:hypothetical protein n=1 Tax=Cronobacter sakazakii TaxID=28141 RepID=UPI0004A93012|nr:hypothetical protein [Cronobacter sakazakii]EGT5204823.1 hypothetical protein [Cronobacter sakazakii]EGT5755612.1 hypothetical protein [Cronobacter sakazakii]EJG0817012.1 hypothetical protein [Cronobacter sakazakii]EJG2179645.1 hypothetical protein [Cronobacter sakazakii]KDP99098.1 hypothetical protein ER21_07260 [Cronobacter sakazakii]